MSIIKVFKNYTPALSAPELITISQSETPPEGPGEEFTGIYDFYECQMFINRSIRKIQFPKDWKEKTGKYSVQFQKFKIKTFQIVCSE